MNKFIRFYNKNRHMVWVVILTISAIIILIQVLDKFAYENKKKNEEINGTSIKHTSTINNNYSVITGQKIDQNIKVIIDEFIDLCNKKEISKAYEMLSAECKDMLYPTLDSFTQNYYNRIFESKKSYVCQSWITGNNLYTYKIDFVPDMLATGKPAQTSITDYYTVVKENDEYKLNINKFINSKKVDATKISNNIIVKVNRKNIYMDYEIYDIEVTNNLISTIMLDDMQSSKNVYIEDSKENRYLWYNNEILENDITIRNGFKQQISIKFDKMYNQNNETKRIVFYNIILDSGKSVEISIDI